MVVVEKRNTDAKSATATGAAFTVVVVVVDVVVVVVTVVVVVLVVVVVVGPPPPPPPPPPPMVVDGAVGPEPALVVVFESVVDVADPATVVDDAPGRVVDVDSLPPSVLVTPPGPTVVATGFPSRSRATDVVCASGAPGVPDPPAPDCSPALATPAAAIWSCADDDGVASVGTWNAISPTAAARDATTVVPAADTAVVAGANSGICDNYAKGPAMRCRRPTDIPRNARTISGSNWVPLFRVSS